MPPSLPMLDSCPFEKLDDALGLTHIAAELSPGKPAPVATSDTTSSRCSDSPSTAALLATMTPMMPNAFPKTQP